MLRFLEAVGERMLRLVAPSVSADAAVCGPWKYDFCASSGCFLPWQNRLKYSRECTNGEFIWYEPKYGDCGSCAA